MTHPLLVVYCNGQGYVLKRARDIFLYLSILRLKAHTPVLSQGTKPNKRCKFSTCMHAKCLQNQLLWQMDQVVHFGCERIIEVTHRLEIGLDHPGEMKSIVVRHLKRAHNTTDIP